MKAIDRPIRWTPRIHYSGVYFIQVATVDIFKIGISCDCWQRFYILQGSNPYELLLYGVIVTQDQIAIEDTLHDRFKEKWIRNEWFNLSHVEVDAVLREYGGVNL